MIRIRGTIGQWPVDLSVELESVDWQRLAAQVTPAVAEAPAASTPRAGQDDALWANALRLVEQAGRINGPALMEQLESLAGNATAAKRLLVRLRHCPQVRVLTQADAPLYCWQG
ncbi:hypothetical protein [Pseudomonas typographi]|uniref:Uncharacterized protein n=1 Tax=Pseudomonas typographi TaxID=2715964 RepID=A0ABR7Z5D6_9PSED|nr:hypothetical protein [Pseudomonas typographi]MBD1553064.1 hypothetical protein [Pseudomonas typographi]MBD1588409.1 hypothetical protein [Pseudomonas typographi]MBD1600516.1 hypothetical protein [Pseudomonas typographi]